MLGYFIEAAAIIGLIALTVFIIRRSAVENAVSFIALLASSFVASVTVLCALLFLSLINNPLTRYAIIFAAYLLTFGLVSVLARRRIRRDDRAFIRQMEDKYKLSVRVSRSLSVAAALFVDVALVFLIFGFINIYASADAALPDRIRATTFVIHRLLIDRPALNGNDQQTTIRPRDDQSATVDSSSAPVSRRSIKNVIADTTGVTSVVEHIEAIHFLSALTIEEKTYIVNQTPALKQLSEYPPLLEFYQNEIIFAEFDDLESASADIVYRLMNEPLVHELINDPFIQESVRQIDLLAIRDEAKAFRLRMRLAVPLQWKTDTIDSSLDLQDVLSQADSWRNQPLGSTRLEWIETGMFGVATATLSDTDGGRMELECGCNGALSVWVGLELLSPVRKNNQWIAAFDLTANEPAVIVLMIDLTKNQERCCDVSIFMRPLATIVEDE